MRINCDRTPQQEGWPLANDLETLTAEIAAAGSVQRVILFGSGANGRLNDRSDLDFAVFSTATSLREQGRRIQQRLGRRRAIDLLIERPPALETDDWTRDLVEGGLTLWINGQAISYETARAQARAERTKRAVRAYTAKDGCSLRDEGDDELREAQLQRGRRVQPLAPLGGALFSTGRGATDRHRTTHRAYRSTWGLLAAAVVQRREVAYKASLRTLAVQSQEDGTCKPIKQELINRLEQWRWKWRFKGESAPTDRRPSSASRPPRARGDEPRPTLE